MCRGIAFDLGFLGTIIMRRLSSIALSSSVVVVGVVVPV